MLALKKPQEIKEQNYLALDNCAHVFVLEILEKNFGKLISPREIPTLRLLGEHRNNTRAAACRPNSVRQSTWEQITHGIPRGALPGKLKVKTRQ